MAYCRTRKIKNIIQLSKVNTLTKRRILNEKSPAIKINGAYVNAPYMHPTPRINTHSLWAYIQLLNEYICIQSSNIYKIIIMLNLQYLNMSIV